MTPPASTASRDGLSCPQQRSAWTLGFAPGLSLEGGHCLRRDFNRPDQPPVFVWLGSRDEGRGGWRDFEVPREMFFFL